MAIQLSVPVQPTQKMVDDYNNRTHKHIERVRRCLRVLASVTKYSEQLLERAELHDASKFEPDEFIPYIWLTEFHRCRRSGESFSYPEGMEELVKKAIEHHVKSNRHHPEFHCRPDEMTKLDLIEMVCDWTAMAQEFEEDNGSARRYAEKTVGSRFQFNDENQNFIFEIINCLDAELLQGIYSV